jgi:hypothetical protein
MKEKKELASCREVPGLNNNGVILQGDISPGFFG